MGELVTIAEDALLARQKLPKAFGVEAVQPSYDGLGLPNIAALALELLCPDAPSLSEQPALPPFNPDLLALQAVTDAWETWQRQAPVNHVVLFLVDALGYDQLRILMAEGDAPGLASACVRQESFFLPATSVFPSTTVTALSSAATAYAPAQHGVMCTKMYIPELGSVANIIQWRPSLAPTTTPYLDSQLNPDTLLPVPNLYLRLEKAGVNVEMVNFRQFKGSSISRFTSVGSEAGTSGYTGYLTPTDGFVQLRDRLLAKSNNTKSFTYLYVPNIDTAAHRYGPLSSSYRAEVAALDFSLKRELLEPLAGRNDIVLLLVADHGQRRAYPDKILWLNQHPDLVQQLFVPSTGESQCRFLHLRHGAEATVMDYVQNYLADRFLAVSKAEAISLGLFGLPGQPPIEKYSDRIGDLILIPHTDWACFPEEHSPIIAGVHGGLSRAEMLIPFLAYRF